MTMNTRMKLMLLCLLTGTATAETNAPARDYFMINFDTGLTSTILEIGTTSLTFSVDWKPEVGTPRTLDLIGRLLPETRGWSGLQELELDQASSAFGDEGWWFRFPTEVDLVQRKAVFEIPYDAIGWCEWEEEKAKFEQRAFFSVQWPVGTEEEWWDVYGREDNENFSLSAYDLGLVTNAENSVQEQEADVKQTQTAQGGIPAKAGVANAQGEADEVSTPHQPISNRWLYLGLLLGAVCVMLYFLRKK